MSCMEPNLVDERNASNVTPIVTTVCLISIAKIAVTWQQVIDPCTKRFFRCNAFLSVLPIKARGISLLQKKRTRFFSEQNDFYGFLMDFSSKQKDFCQRRTRFFGVKCPSNQRPWPDVFSASRTANSSGNFLKVVRFR